MSLEGERLGHYRLLRLLGSGGMGEVYLAEDARIGQQVAIKVIRTEGMAYPERKSTNEAARLFEREARAIARLDHPNILPLYAYGEETLHGQPLNYLVMPYRKDGTLADWLRQRGSKALLSPVEVVPLLQQAADALQHAHDQQVIHQDIKPTNFLVRLRPDQPNRPDLLLADFGIAKLTSATASASQSIRGTPIYMAPELWDGHPLPATDQYALAIMAYELLVGQPPFQGGPGQVMRQHYLELPPVPSALNSRLSPAIDAALLRALSKQPEERFPSVAAFARAFHEAVQSSAELRATLAISRAEAQSGTTRRLTLPGGRQVSVTVPAGVGDGTMLRLEGQGMPYYTGGPAGLLALTITILSIENPLSLLRDSGEITALVSMPTMEAPSVEDTRVTPVRSSTPLPLPLTPLPLTPLPLTVRPDVKAPAPPAKRGGSRRFVLIGLVGLVIVALVSGVTWTWLIHPHPAVTVTPHPAVTITPHPAVTITPQIAGVIAEFAIHTPQSEPDGITAGPDDGNVWFTLFASNQIGRITPNGVITIFSLPGFQSEPYGITAGPDGNVWFTEYGSGQIGRITPNGFITEFAIPTFQCVPEGITLGSDGNLWFTEWSGEKIGRITPSGNITEFPLSLTLTGNPSLIAAGPDGNLWFTEGGSNKIGRINPNGIPNGAITEFTIPTSQSEPEGITAGPDGNVWFTEYGSNKIGRITRKGTFTEFRIPTSQSEPYGITAGLDGNLWFTESASGSNKIGRITPDGVITEFPIPTSQSFSEGITAGPDGNLWFTEYGSNKTGRITSGK